MKKKNIFNQVVYFFISYGNFYRYINTITTYSDKCGIYYLI